LKIFLDKTYVITAGKDKCLRCFQLDPATHELEPKIEYLNVHRAGIYSMCATYGTGKVYTGDGYGQLMLWKVSEERLLMDLGEVHKGIIHQIGKFPLVKRYK
jgi:hypothetical protein